jgi:hypothetical protein
MHRPLLAAVLPLALFACADHASEDVAGSSDDITTISDLGGLEANLGLVKDPNRTRPEAIVKAGPCYQTMDQSGRDWNLRRYTKGAAFFYTKADGTYLDEIACVDLDVTQNGQPATIALGDLSLDIAQRFQLGRMTTSVSGGDPTGGGVATFAFERGATMEIGTIPSNFAVELKDNVPGYDGAFRGFIRAVSAPTLPADRTPLGPGQFVPSITKLLPSIALLAYRYAKQDGPFSIANDGVGKLVSIEDLSLGDFDAWRYVAHFEKVDVEYTYNAASESDVGGSRPARDWLTLSDRTTKSPVAGCTRVVDGRPHDLACWIEPTHGKWEIPWGVDCY